jgi:hypothetical protein
MDRDGVSVRAWRDTAIHHSSSVAYSARDLSEDEVMNSGQFRKGKLHGKQFPKGEHHPKAKLTATQVLAIFRDPRPHHAIARDYGIQSYWGF